MRKAIITFAILVSVSFLGMTDANAQNLDSLLGVWNNKSQPDSNRVQAYKDYIWKGYLFSKPDSAAILAEALHGYAKKHKYPKASATGYNLQGIANAVQGNHPRALEYYEKCLAINEEFGDKNGIADNLGNIGNIYYLQSDYPKALEYFFKALKILEELGNKNGIAASLGNIGNIYYFQSDYPKALEYYHKALKINEELGYKSGIASNLAAIGNIYADQSDYPKALEYYLKALKMEEEIGNKSGIAANLGNIGYIYSSQSDYPTALEYYHKALNMEEEMGNKSGIASNLGNIGNIFREQSDYPKALEFYLKSLKIDEENGNKMGVANNLGNIGNIYSSQLVYPTALEYYYKALKMEEEMGNKSGIASNLGNIGVIYMNQTDYPKALEYYHKALKINEELGNKSGIANNLINMGSAYSQKGELDKSLEYLKKGLKLNIEIQNHRQTAYTLNMLASNYINQAKIYDSLRTIGESRDYLVDSKIENSYQSALQFAKEAERLADSIGLAELQPKIFHNLYEAYKKLNEPAKALEYHEKYTIMNDSIFSMEKSKEIATLEAKRENELKDKEIVILQTEKKAQKFQSYLLGGGVIVLLGAFGIAFLRFREKKKLSDKLAIQKNEIENQKLLVEEKNEEIYASIRYASTIQNAILPWDAILGKAFSDFMIFFKPKDIVSGDSYWFKEVDGVKFLAVIDCTGHGIPGSMLTVIASSVLDDAVLGKRLKNTGEILTYMNDKVTEVLNQRLKENEVRDGMEVALIAINANTVQYSGAGRPLYIKNDSFEIMKTDRRGIAGRAEDDNYVYTSLEIERRKNLMLYLTTDGFADQMNESGKKYSSKRFTELLNSIADNPLSEQYKILNNELAAHQGDKHQIDDITILGVRI